ncbi:DoxX family membrane protein [Aquimarina sp. 2201CG5-10]|uniref:DoxX family membrane protein n=1 Tax=Aquimarina callyspongiae TaxID=3098150 RepID=UPI002AB3416E|nr:hypothetical protein [Aquimarina sp. 2201CG5-10]MDY8137885.1 hypothetical protein [Aquimarina sp. 2201CG5-10]
MKFRIYFYTMIRVLFGTYLVAYGAYNVFRYPVFLDRLEKYFTYTSVFDLGIVELLAPLVPFETFIIGLFIAMGIFTRKILIASICLFAFLTVFLLDANADQLALVHFLFLIISVILLAKDNYNLNSVDYSRDSYMLL